MSHDEIIPVLAAWDRLLPQDFLDEPDIEVCHVGNMGRRWALSKVLVTTTKREQKVVMGFRLCFDSVLTESFSNL